MTPREGSLTKTLDSQSRDGGSIPTPSLHFIDLDKRKATEMVIEHHYLHRKCPISWCWGIIMAGLLVGVLTIGKPCSWSTAQGVCGKDRAYDVFELNRLWVRDDLPANTESKFIGWCLRQIRKTRPNIILVSYADSTRGHVGYVYQASNWSYVGQSIPFKDITFKGVSDYRSIPKTQRGAKIGNKRAWANSPDVIRVPRSQKHRYVWFANPDDRRLLRWKSQPYPKSAAKP